MQNDVVMTQACNSPPPLPSSSECRDMEASVREVEKLLEGYQFKDKKLLEEALTHKSFNDQSANYERLEFLGDAALGLAISGHIFQNNPEANEDQLTKLRSVNVSTERLARVAVRHHLYHYLLRNNTASLDKKVEEFTRMVQQEVERELYGGAMEAPRILADVVESVAGAVYVDSGHDLETMWRSFKCLLGRIVSLEELQRQPHPIEELKTLCDRRREKYEFVFQTEGEETIASVYIDGSKLIASGCPCKKKDSAELQAARAALKVLPRNNSDVTFINLERDANGEIQDAKTKLKELCEKRKCLDPKYSDSDRIGPAHDGRFVSSVEIEIFVDSTTGDEKSTIKDAQKSAASKLLLKMMQMQRERNNELYDTGGVFFHLNGEMYITSSSQNICSS